MISLNVGALVSTDRYEEVQNVVLDTAAGGGMSIYCQ